MSRITFAAVHGRVIAVAENVVVAFAARRDFDTFARVILRSRRNPLIVM